MSLLSNIIQYHHKDCIWQGNKVTSLVPCRRLCSLTFSYADILELYVPLCVVQRIMYLKISTLSTSV